MTTKYPVSMMRPEGTAGQVLTSNGTGVAPTFQAGGGGGLTLGTPHILTGNALTIPGIPAGVKQLRLLFSGVGVNNNTIDIKVQFGTLAGIEVSGYRTDSSNIAATVASSSDTSSFIIRVSNVNVRLSGSITFNLIDTSTNLWSSSNAFSKHVAGSAITGVGGGDKTLAGALTQIKLSTTNSLVNFIGSGTVNIAYQ